MLDGGRNGAVKLLRVGRATREGFQVVDLCNVLAGNLLSEDMRVRTCCFYLLLLLCQCLELGSVERCRRRLRSYPVKRSLSC